MNKKLQSKQQNKKLSESFCRNIKIIFQIFLNFYAKKWTTDCNLSSSKQNRSQKASVATPKIKHFTFSVSVCCLSRQIAVVVRSKRETSPKCRRQRATRKSLFMQIHINYSHVCTSSYAINSAFVACKQCNLIHQLREPERATFVLGPANNHFAWFFISPLFMAVHQLVSTKS